MLAVCCSKLLHKDDSSETLSVHSANHHTSKAKGHWCQQMPTTQDLKTDMSRHASAQEFQVSAAIRES